MYYLSLSFLAVASIPFCLRWLCVVSRSSPNFPGSSSYASLGSPARVLSRFQVQHSHESISVSFIYCYNVSLQHLHGKRDSSGILFSPLKYYFEFKKNITVLTITCTLPSRLSGNLLRKFMCVGDQWEV